MNLAADLLQFDGLSAGVVIALFFVALAAGFIDSIAGGGGLLTIPAFLILAPSVHPVTVLATNKLQGTFGSAMSSFTYYKAGHLPVRKYLFGFACSFIGSAIGTLLVGSLSSDLLNRLIPILLIVMAIYFAVSPKLGDVDKHAWMTPMQHGLTFGLVIGAYDGFFGPGTGSFFVLSCVAFLGLGITSATAYTKFLNFASNIASLLFFVLTAPILIKTGLLMGVGQLIGARLGANFALKNGAKIIKPLLVLVCVSVSVKLLFF